MTKDRIGKILFGIAGMLIVACELVVVCMPAVENIGGITYDHTAIGYLAAIILLIIGSLFIKKPVSAVVFAVMLILNIWFFTVSVLDLNNGGFGAFFFLLVAHIVVGIIYCFFTVNYMFPRVLDSSILFVLAVVLVICLSIFSYFAFWFFENIFFLVITFALLSLAWFISAFKKPAVESAQ